MFYLNMQMPSRLIHSFTGDLTAEDWASSGQELRVASEVSMSGLFIDSLNHFKCYIERDDTLISIVIFR